MPTETKVAYGSTGKAKYAAAFRRMTGAGAQVFNVVSADRNVATFKLVKKSYYTQHGGFDGAKQGVASGDAVYITLCSTSTGADFPENARPSARHHSESNIVGAILNSYRGISFDSYYIKWVYTERRPCHSGSYAGACSSLLTSLCFQQENAGNAGVARWEQRVPGPPFPIYYSFDYDEDASGGITAYLSGGGAPVQLSSTIARHGECLTMITLDRIHIDNDIA